MRYSAVLSIMALWSVLACSEVSAQWIYGLGNKTCGTWLSKRASNAHYDMAQWMLGYVSAAGYYGPFTMRESEGDAFIAWMDNYCRQNPLQEFAPAVRALIQELSRK